MTDNEKELDKRLGSFSLPIITSLSQKTKKKFDPEKFARAAAELRAAEIDAFRFPNNNTPERS